MSETDFKFILERSKRTAEREERRRNKHPSTCKREIRTFEGVNQRTTGHPAACTFYAVEFVSRASQCISKDITAEWIFSLLMEPQIPIEEGGIHPEAIDVVRLLSPAFRPHGNDSQCVTGGSLALKNVLTEGLSKPDCCGVLIINGVETIGVAKTKDGSICLFDSHGDSTQTEPSFCFLWQNNCSINDASLGIADFIEERSSQEQFEIGEMVDVLFVDH